MLSSYDALFPADDWVEIEMTARLNGIDPVPARLLYDQADPWAVTLVLNVGDRAEREWLFGRDLLASGMLREVGDGDVRISPEGDLVWVTLTSPSGRAELAFPRAAMEKALEKTEDMVPPGAEGEFFDWDREWDLFTGEAA